jgi:diguanylate cyclase (GGDEF)-like protein
MTDNFHNPEGSRSLFGRQDLRLWIESTSGDEKGPAIRHHDSLVLPLNMPNVTSTFDTQEFGIVSWEADPVTMRFTWVSENAKDLLGYARDEWLEREDFWSRHIDVRDQNRAIAKRANAVLDDSKTRFTYRMIARDGSRVEVQESCTWKKNLDGTVVLRGCLVPGDFGLQEQSYAQTLGNLVREIPGLMWTCDQHLNVTWSLGTDFSVLKIQSERPRNANLFDLFRVEDEQRIHVAMHVRAVNGEFLSYEVQSAGRTHQVTLKPYFSSSKRPDGCLGLAMDITERKWAEERMFRMAVTDPLTGLANYRCFREILDHEMRRANRTKRPLTLLLFDMDGLKKINDAHGHLAGSRALCRLAHALNTASRAIDISARFGGDEFALILPETDRNEALQVAERICDFLKKDVETPRISASVGAGSYVFGAGADELIAAADRDLYRQKNLRLSHRA